MHTYYVAVTVGLQNPEAVDDGPVGDGVVVKTHDPITTRNGLAEAINAVARLLKVDPALIVILHHIELNPVQATPKPKLDELWREQALTNDQVMAIRSLLAHAYGNPHSATFSANPEVTRWVDVLPVWLRNAIVSG